MKNRINKLYSNGEIEYIRQHIEKQSIADIAKNLGRSTQGVASKVSELRKNNQIHESEYIYLYTLLKRLGYGPCGSDEYYIAWVKKRQLPTHKIQKNKKAYQVVFIKEFWEWAYENQYTIDFSRLQKNALGPEPDWVQDKRERDKNHREEFQLYDKWTAEEDSRLEELILSRKYNYREISLIMHRTECAIKKRKRLLNICGKVSRTGSEKWSAYELETLIGLIQNGCRYENFADALGRSVKAIRGKVFKIFGTEDLDKVRGILTDNHFKQEDIVL